jgi:hypothetical protein
MREFSALSPARFELTCGAFRQCNLCRFHAHEAVSILDQQSLRSEPTIMIRGQGFFSADLQAHESSQFF